RRGDKVAELRAAYGGLAARAMRARSVEGAVKGRPWAPAWLADIDVLLARDFTPIADHRGGAAYRLRAAAGLLRRFQLETSLAEPMRVEALGATSRNEFAAQSTLRWATTAPSSMSPARRATSMMFRSYQERWKRPWCGSRLPSPVPAASTSPPLSPPRA